MSLAQNYATVLRSIAPKEVVAYMKAKGHLSLLPQVLRILERGKEDSEVVTVANEKDAKHFNGVRIVIDPKIVGGHVRRKGSKLTDASYRKALVEVYKLATKD